MCRVRTLAGRCRRALTACAAVALSGAAVALSCADARAQTNHGGQVWSGISVSAPLTKRLSVSSRFQRRVSTRNVAYAPAVYLPPVIAWRLDDRLTLSGGFIYAFIDGARLPHDLHEDRWFQQASYGLGRAGPVALRAATRFEQRTRSNGQDWNRRIAQLVGASLPLTGAGDKGPVGVVTEELYWNLDSADWGARKGFDELRSFVGVQTPIAGRMSLEIGYLNQRQRQVAGRLTMNHILVVGLNFRFARRER